MRFPDFAFQNLMLLSLVPPALASTSACHGHHDRALTADWCWLRECTGREVSRRSHRRTRLSLAPLAR